MRALVFDAPAEDTGATRITDLREPRPGPGQISIDVGYAGVNFKDVMARRGDSGYVDGWPFVPGLEVAGLVREVGPDVSDRQVGQPVVAFTGAGGLAEVAVASAALTVELPADLDPERAAGATGALVTAALLLGQVGRLRPAESLLVHGAAGGVGQAVAQLARLLGAGAVLGTVGGPSRVEAARAAGYDAVFVRQPDLAGAIRRHQPDGVDLVLDPQGTALLEDDLQIAAPGGRIVLFGNAGGGTLGALPPVGALFGRNLTISGFSLAALAANAPLRITEALRQVLRHLADGELDLDVTHVAGLDAAPEAQQALAEGRGRGKQIVQVAELRWPTTSSAGHVTMSGATA